MYLNPTDGPYIVEFLEPLPESVHYHWYSLNGHILDIGYSANKTPSDIAAWADGTYVLAVFFPAGAEALRVTKITH